MSEFDIAEINKIIEEVQAKFNCAPGQQATVITATDGFKTLDRFGWGITRVKKDGTLLQLINIRFETYEARPSRRAQRCIIPIDGFYEWRKDARTKQPFYFHHSQNELLALAGLYELTDADEHEHRFAIVTIPAHGAVAEIHDRMPFIIPREYHADWLSGADCLEIIEEVSDYVTKIVVSHPVSPIVNSPANDSPVCIEPFKPHTLFGD